MSNNNKEVREVAYITGNIKEIRRYRRPIVFGRQSIHRRSNDHNAPVGSSDKNRLDALKRKRDAIRRIINTNRSENDILATFTFADTVADEVLARKSFYNFTQRLRYNHNANKYIWAMERHRHSHLDELPGIHFHTVLFQWPGISESELQDIWGLGSVRTDDTSNKYNLGSYFSNYVTKVKDNQLSGRTWNYSKNLRKPEKELREEYSCIQEESILFESEPWPNNFYGEVQTLYIHNERK